MYKVFLNEKVIVLTEEHAIERMSAHMLYFQYDDFEEINFVISLLEGHPDLHGVIIQYQDLAELWADFRAHFREIEAAGGLVHNNLGELLFIHRLGKWDLPKGKCESGESIDACALREVQEECGIDDLDIVAKLPDTYHTYTMNGMRHLKRTYWYKMSSRQQKLTPQLDEGITEAKWIAPADVNWDAMPTYPNIRQLVDPQL